jgi:hypothetical protein
MKRLLLAAAAIAALTGAANAGYCSEEYIAIQSLDSLWASASDSWSAYVDAARKLGEPLSEKGKEAKRRADELWNDEQTRAQAYVGHKECNPVDRANIKGFIR